jgi:DNA-directed RNA polymerase specialized sigma24 family protein
MHAATRRTRAQTTRSGDLIDLSAIGWKEAALVALVILAGYMGYALVRLSMLNARRTAEAAPPPVPEAPVPPPPVDLQAELDVLLDARLAPLMQALETRLDLIEDRLDGVSRRLETVNQLPPVAPQYSEALSLAARGLSAEDIAEQCDMSVGEAELVRTLAQSRGMGDRT